MPVRNEPPVKGGWYVHYLSRNGIQKFCFLFDYNIMNWIIEMSERQTPVYPMFFHPVQMTIPEIQRLMDSSTFDVISKDG